MFSTARLKHLTAKNRIIRSATNDHLGNPDGTVSDEEITMYDTLAANDVGTIITGHLSVSPDLDYRADEMQLCIGDDRFIEGLSQIPAKIHEYGAIAIAQISLAGPKGLTPFDFNTLSTEKMQEIRDWFISAAVRAKKTGFDGVQVHVAHWYFLQAVVNINLNHRTDLYGGSPENCIRLPKEIIAGIREACGDDFILMVKVNAHNSNDKDDYNLLTFYCRKKSAVSIDRKVRGMNPWPGVFTKFNGKQLKIWRTKPVPGTIKGEPGTIVGVSKDAIEVAVGDGTLIIYELQLEGKKRMSAHDFLLGVKPDVGECLGKSES